MSNQQLPRQATAAGSAVGRATGFEGRLDVGEVAMPGRFQVGQVVAERDAERLGGPVRARTTRRDRCPEEVEEG